jgi:hypothetical protein
VEEYKAAEKPDYIDWGFEDSKLDDNWFHIIIRSSKKFIDTFVLSTIYTKMFKENAK